MSSAFLDIPLAEEDDMHLDCSLGKTCCGFLWIADNFYCVYGS